MAKSSLASLARQIGRPTPKAATEEVDIITFIEADWGLNLRLFPAQKVILKVSYGLPLDDKERFEIHDWKHESKRMVTEKELLQIWFDEGRSNIREVVPGKQRRNMVLSLGRRSGKTAISACVAAYETYKLILKGNPQQYYGLTPSNSIKLMSIAVGKKQAGLLYDEMLGHFKRCPIFSQYTANSTLSYARFQSPNDIEKYGLYAENPNALATIEASFYACNASSIRGSGNIVVILDEVAHFIEAGRSSAEQVYDAVAPSLAAFTEKDEDKRPVPGAESDGRLILISSPLGKQGLFYKMFRVGMSGNKASENMFCVQAPTWEINPTVPASVFHESYSKDPNVFFTEFGGMFTDRTQGWIEEEKDLLDCVDSSLKPRARGITRRPHFVGFDLGLVGDGSAIAIVHIEDDRIILDYIDQIKAGEGKFRGQQRLEFDDVADWILELSRKFYMYQGLFDHWNGIPLEQALAKRGLTQFKSETFTPTKKSEIFQNFKALMYDKKIGLYDISDADKRAYEARGEMAPLHLPYIDQLLELQAEQRSKYIINVEAPKGQNKHDDYADALVRAVWLASQGLGKLRHIARSKHPERPNLPKVSNRIQRLNHRNRLLGGSDPKRQIPKKRRYF